MFFEGEDWHDGSDSEDLAWIESERCIIIVSVNVDVSVLVFLAGV